MTNAKKRRRDKHHTSAEFFPDNASKREKDFKDDLLSLPLDDIGVHSAILQCLKRYFYLFQATAPQVASSVAFSDFGNSILLQSHTGTGKTLAFLIPIAQRLLRFHEKFTEAFDKPYRSSKIHTVIVVPTHELCTQVSAHCSLLLSHIPYDMRVIQGIDALDIGGLSSTSDRQNRRHRRWGGSVLLITPVDFKKLQNLLSKDLLNDLFKVEENDKERQGPHHHLTFVIDEVDLVLKKWDFFLEAFLSFKKEMDVANIPIDFGFFGATATSCSLVQDVMQNLQKDHACYSFNMMLQRGQCSASQNHLGSVLERLCALLPPIEVKNSHGNSSASNRQWFTFLFVDGQCASLNTKNLFVPIKKDDLMQKLSLLVHILCIHHTKKHIVFFHDYKEASAAHDKLALICQQKMLPDDIENIHLFHEHLTASQRSASYLAFLKKTEARSDRSILLCTDHLAHGIDIRDISYVVHFDAPKTQESYLHRIGRTGRMGTQGTSVLFIDTALETEIFNTLNSAAALEEWKLHSPIMIYL